MPDAAQFQHHAEFSPPSAEFEIAGARFMADPSGALWWPAERMLIVADLHLEKGSAQAARGRLLPPYDTAATLERLAVLCQRHMPRTVLALGDSFHDRSAGARIARDDVARLSQLALGRDWIWIAGNHDPDRPAHIGGDWMAVLRHGGMTFRHEPDASLASGELAGHLHPVAKVRVRGHVLRRRCVATDGRRAILPAFGAYAGGLNLRDAAFRDLFSHDALTAWMLGTRAVYPMMAASLLPDDRGSGDVRFGAIIAG